MKYLEKMIKKRLGEVLLEEGLVTNEQVSEALNLQKKSSKRMGELLVELGYVSEQDIARTLAMQFQLPFISLKDYRLDKNLINSIPRELLHEYQLVPLDQMSGILVIVMAGFISRELMEQLQKISGCELAIYIGLSSEVRVVLDENCPLPTAKIAERSREIRKKEITEAIVKPTEPPAEAPLQPAAGAPAAAQKPAAAPAAQNAPPRSPGQQPVPGKPVQPGAPHAGTALPRPPAQPPAPGKPAQPGEPQQPAARRAKGPSSIFKTASSPDIASIHREDDGSKTYEIAAPNVDDQNEWQKVLKEADAVLDESGGSGDDWLKMFDDAEAAVRDDIKKKLEEGEEERR
jgi:hypothetical protein